MDPVKHGKVTHCAHPQSRLNSSNAWSLLNFVLSLKQAGFLLIINVHVCLLPTSSSINQCVFERVCVCGVFHMVASLVACWQVAGVRRPLPPTCNESNTVPHVCLHN